MDLSRRTIMAAAGTAAATATLGLTPASAGAPMAGKQAPGFYRYKIGDLEVTAINDGHFTRPKPAEGFVRNASADDVTKALTEAGMSADALPIPFTTTVINTGSKLIAIDSGNGDSGAPTSGKWLGNLRASGYEPAQVDHVIVSHFHGDHINGLRLKNGDAVFPNAEIMVPGLEWDFWMDDARMNAAPDAMKPAFNNVRRVFGPLAGKVTKYDHGKDVLPGIGAVAATGHTPGHTAFTVSSGSGKLLVLSDTANHPALFVRYPEWQAIFDMDGAKATETRKRLLDMAVADKLQVAFYHAPFPAAGTIAKDGAGYKLMAAQWTA